MRMNVFSWKKVEEDIDITETDTIADIFNYKIQNLGRG